MNWKFWRPSITKEQAKEEIARMYAKYNEVYEYGFFGFLVGSSLCGNIQGDSARFWELKKIIDR